MSITLDGSLGITSPSETVPNTFSSSSNFGFKSKIINGAMVIDQRNAGASVTFPSSGLNAFIVDRWHTYKQIATGGSFTGARSTTAPAGFINSTLITITSAVTDTASTVNAMAQFIEGLNVSDLGWGTASAQAVTVSFWVRSSVTGTYSLAISNDGYDYSYVTNYTISVANTWEQKTVTIAGPTAGTWLTTNAAGLRLWFDLGTGTGRNGTANAWSASQIYRTAGSVQLLANNAATFYITGVQLEKGSTATSFDYRPYGTELSLCQRYYLKTLIATGLRFGMGRNLTTTTANIGIFFPVSMRIAPTALEQTGTATDYGIGYLSSGTTCTSIPTFASSTTLFSTVIFTVTTLLTAGQGCEGYANTSNAFLGWSAEL